MRYIAYYRVSTDKQGQSGLGLEAQRKAVEPWADKIFGEFTEVESGKDDHRPQLLEAIKTCREFGHGLLIAKIDRLSRDAAFLLTLRKSGVEILAADMPNCSSLEFGIRAVVAQHEREEISRRTKAALSAAKERGTKMGSPTPERGGSVTGAKRRAEAQLYAEKIIPTIREIQSRGLTSTRQIADELARLQIPTPRGGSWHTSQVSNILRRIDEKSE